MTHDDASFGFCTFVDNFHPKEKKRNSKWHRSWMSIMSRSLSSCWDTFLHAYARSDLKRRRFGDKGSSKDVWKAYRQSLHLIGLTWCIQKYNTCIRGKWKEKACNATILNTVYYKNSIGAVSKICYPHWQNNAEHGKTSDSVKAPSTNIKCPFPCIAKSLQLPPKECSYPKNGQCVNRKVSVPFDGFFIVADWSGQYQPSWGSWSIQNGKFLHIWLPTLKGWKTFKTNSSEFSI